jgi:hypothetical protein
LGNPHPLFDCNAYLAEHPDVAQRGVNPLLHYLRSLTATVVARNHDREGVVSSGNDPGRADALVSARPPGRAFLEILDVTVDVAFWEDADGRMSFIAEVQQRPFFRAMRFDQLSAQLKP